MSNRWDKGLAIEFLALAAILIVLQIRSLCILPAPNSIRWFGDESWLMSEAKMQIATGVVRYPLAAGSTLEHSKGLVLSMTWLSSLIYGAPTAIIHADPIVIGRSITALLSLLLCAALFACSRKFGASRSVAAFVVVLLVSSRAFLFSSHSCRTDLFAGLVVLLFVTILSKLSIDQKDHSLRWWFGLGAIVMFLAVSSSIHLLTLLIPVTIYYVWRLGGYSKWTRALSAKLGAVSVLVLLLIVYYATTGNLTLFVPSSGHMQFHDVLSSIPILRPFSRSVQISNIVIRVKQFASEAPQAYLLLLLLTFYVRFRKSSVESVSVALPASLILLSWLFLEGAEVNYLIHILPLLLLATAIVVERLTAPSPKIVCTFMLAIAISFSVLSVRDAISGRSNAREIDQSNQTATAQIEAAMRSDWKGMETARVVSEPPTLARLSQVSGVDVITDHFISFPTRQEPLDSFLQREHVDYVVLYNSPTYPKDRHRDDPFYQDVHRLGTLRLSVIGKAGDIGRDYFTPSNWQDTVLLFRIGRTHD